MPDVSSLETRVSPDKGYSAEPPTKEGLRGFVCPRADAYGGRDGIIPPGVAAVRGLVPKGMRRISPSDTARRANAARDSGKSDVDQYREYYGRGAAERAEKSGKAAEAPAPAPVPTHAPSPVHPLVPSPETAIPRPAPRPGERVLADPDDPGMFSRAPGRDAGDDTLDGFYDGLRGVLPGTGDSAPGRGADTGLRPGQGVTATAGKAVRTDMAERAAPPAPPPPAQEASGLEDRRDMDPLRNMVSAQLWRETANERDRLRAEVERLTVWVHELQRKVEGAEARDAHYAEVERELRSRPAGEAQGETVRVPLSQDEERLKVGGRDWECNVVGAVHRGRSGRSVVLTVSDPAYASELLAEIRPGEVVVLSGGERTSCAYSGRCAKIYGDAGSPDFIAVFWLDVAPGK